MHGLSKSRILAHLQCPRRLWLQVHRPELAEYDDGASARFAAGERVGEVARALEPGGVLIEARDPAEALRATGEIGEIEIGDREIGDRPPFPRMGNGGLSPISPISPLFEPAFQANGVLVRPDILKPDGRGWCMTEVKSAASVKPYHLTDAAVQAWVVRAAGVALARIEVAHVDTAFVYPGGGDYRGLLTHADVTDEIADLEPEVPDWIAGARATLAGDDPRTDPGDHCNDPFACPFLAHCRPEDPAAFPPEILPRGRALAARLREEGFDDLRDVPATRLSHPLHLRILEATRTGRPWIDTNAARILADLPRPLHYLDFETIAFAVPVWAGTRPYQQVPFQWSCHIEDARGAIMHREFLADGTDDPRRAFAETLIEALGTHGAILVWHAAFERSRIHELADAFPDLAADLHAACERIVDLLPITREHYYHPDMRGSWSIKAVLPTIAPELAYDGLAVADGGMAQEAFAEMMRGDTAPERRAELRAGLREYCERDTWGMVRVGQFLLCTRKR